MSGQKQWTQAEALARAAAQSHADSANAAFWLGKALAAQGKNAEALTAFQRARDLDALRFRADSEIHQRLSAQGETTPFVDGVAVLAAADSNGIPGHEHFYEHVHLTFAGNYELAKAFAAKAEELLGLKSGQAWLTADACAEALGLTPFHQRQIIQEMRGRLNSPPFDAQSGHAARDARLAAEESALAAQMTAAMGQRAIAGFEKRIAADPDDWQMRHSTRSCWVPSGKKLKPRNSGKRLSKHSHMILRRFISWVPVAIA